MKFKHIILVSIFFIGTACKNNKTNVDSKIEVVDARSIQLGPIRHDSLTKQQLDKVRIIYETFAEVDVSGLDVLVTNFKRDQNPDSEINVWLEMANVYSTFLSKHNKLSLDKKKEVYKLVLLRSMMEEKAAAENVKAKFLSTREINEVLSIYNKPPTPITVVK